ncbi:MAG: T9SS type A sorting domain-containing protein [Raineya sp.]|jgi:hypothetical protein|nr:T9SS type A sorting domain-containing protein [Raineya sp.]
MKKSLSVLFLFLMTQFVWAQDKCAAHIFEQQLRAKYPQLGTVQGFEAWMSQKIAERRSNPTARSGPYKIAVIIHVIHDGSAIANGSQNIPYAQAISQIRVLNEDFHRTNADASSTRAVFNPHVGSMPDLEFVLATKDPNGNVLPEVGVERINGVARFGVSAWSGPGGNTDSQLKPNTIWDPTKYLNLWCVNFSSSGLFGYAQFPEGSTLPGMPGGAQTANTDGVVINFKSMGSNYTSTGAAAPGGPFITNPIAAGTDRGRTTTHEIGHWLGLRHSWGDGDCSVDDFCSDTPNQNGDSPLTTNCATSQTRNTCTALEPDYSNTDAPDQIENYMDYSADICMNMFSADQATRMYTVMENSPRRNTLTAAAATVAAPILTGAYPFITPNKTSITEGDQVSFSGSGRMGDNETPSTISSWSWNFDVDGLGGASPATSTSQNPGNVTFSKAGVYKVRLTISNGTVSGVTTVNINSGLKAPTNLQFTNREGTGSNVKVIDKANLQWNDNSSSEDSYTVERKKNSEPIASYVVIATLPANTTTYSDVFGSSNQVESGVNYNYRISAKKGSETGSITGSIRVELTTAFEDEFSREVQLYPNPAQKGFTIDLKNIQTQKAQTQLYNSLGQVVASKTIENSQVEYNIEGLSKGMYILKIQTDKGTAIKRLVIN